MKLEAIPTIIAFDPYTQSVNDQHLLGERIICADGRSFRYGKDSGSGSHPGYLQQGPAIIANHQNMAVSAAVAIGGTLVTVTPGATAGASGLYDEGYAVVTAGAGIGQTLKISHTPTITASTAFTIVLADPLAVALDTTSTIGLVHNTYKNTREVAGIARPAGVSLITATASYYYWQQIGGIAGVLADGTNGVIGSKAIADASTAGAVDVDAAYTSPVVGYFVQTSVNTSTEPVFLQIA
jgi:hypothetical protein